MTIRAPANKSESTGFRVIGTRPIRHDATDKVTGQARYGADITLPGLLYGKILRRQGHITQAEEVLEDALQRLRKAGDLRCTVRTLTALGIARIEGDEPIRAREALVRSLELGRSLDEAQYSRVALAGIAGLLVSSGRMREAATLYGYAEKLGREQRIPVTTPSMVKRAKVTESLRSSMGHAEFDRSWQEGEAMNLDEAIMEN